VSFFRLRSPSVPMSFALFAPLLAAALSAPCIRAFRRAQWTFPSSASTILIDADTSTRISAGFPNSTFGLVVEFGSGVEDFSKTRPYTSNLVLALVKAFTADAVVQAIERKAQGTSVGLDLRRAFLFTLFGFLYAGVLEWILYMDIFSRLCPNMIRFANEPWDVKRSDVAGLHDLMKQVMFDNFVFYAFLYIPLFYVLKEIVQGSAEGPRIKWDVFRKAFCRYQRNAFADLCAIWAFGIPGDILVFATPMWLRMPTSHLEGLLWTVIYSWLRGAEHDEPNSDHKIQHKHRSPSRNEQATGGATDPSAAQ